MPWKWYTHIGKELVEAMYVAILIAKVPMMADIGPLHSALAALQKWMKERQMKVWLRKMIDVRYSVYSVKDDMPIIISGTIPQCANALGVTVGTFQTQASKQRHGRGNDGSKRKYRIAREEDVVNE